MLACACVFFVFCGVCMIWMWGAAGEGCGGNKSSRAAFLHILLPAKVYYPPCARGCSPHPLAQGEEINLRGRAIYAEVSRAKIYLVLMYCAMTIAKVLCSDDQALCSNEQHFAVTT